MLNKLNDPLREKIFNQEKSLHSVSRNHMPATDVVAHTKRNFGIIKNFIRNIPCVARGIPLVFKQCIAVTKKTIRIFYQEGWRGVEMRLKKLHSDEYIEKIKNYRAFSVGFLIALRLISKSIFSAKKWWLSSGYRAKISNKTINFFQGKIADCNKLKQNNLWVHIDSPRYRCVNAAGHEGAISGWAVIEKKIPVAANVRVYIGNTMYLPHRMQREDVKPVFGVNLDQGFAVGFFLCIKFTSFVNFIRVEIQADSQEWVPIFRTVLFRVPEFLNKLRKKSISYRAWVRKEKRLVKLELEEIRNHISVMLHQPRFSIVIDARDSSFRMRGTLSSIDAQIYPYYDIFILGDREKSGVQNEKKCYSFISNLVEMKNTGDFIVMIAAGQRLACDALYTFADAINKNPTVDLVYGDEDFYTSLRGRHTPFYKPKWSPDYLETFNYIGFTACFRLKEFSDCFDSSSLYDATLKFTERTNNIIHVPKVLGHNNTYLGHPPTDTLAIEGRLLRTGRLGTVVEHPLYQGCHNIELNLSIQPLVSIIIPTAGKTVRIADREIDLILNIVEHILYKSTYKNIEIIVVDNGDLSNKQMEVLENAGCKRLTFSEPVFNISKKLNFGASAANGDLFLLLNDDIEVINPSWIERIVEHFEKKHVGVVGAKLIYPEGLLQHVGVVHNYGNPDHVRRKFPREEAGYFFSTCGVRNYTAVTGACMMVRAEVYGAVGGYSESLAVSFNDIDFCLKVRELQLEIVYAPKAELIHMESLSRIPSLDIKELQWYHKRWAEVLVSDPFYNEQFLTLAPPTFCPCVNPRVL